MIRLLCYLSAGLMLLAGVGRGAGWLSRCGYRGVVFCAACALVDALILFLMYNP